MLENLVEEIIANRTPRMCSVGRWVKTLGTGDRERLRAAFDNTDIGSYEIHAVIRDEVHFSPSTLARHRRGACTCPDMDEL